MGTRYEDIFDTFKDTITDPDLIMFSENIQTEMLCALMRRAISKCRRVCKGQVDLSKRNDDILMFDIEVPDEIIDIIVEWMIVYWLAPYLNNMENLRNSMNTKDFTMFSPANLLEKINNRYDNAYKSARSLTNEYSFIHADFSKLKS